MKRVAIIGSQGIPPKYGGFETLVYYLAKYLGDKYELTIFCSSYSYNNKYDKYLGCKLIYLPLRANGVQSVLYDALSIILTVYGYDKVIVLGSSGGMLMPLIAHRKDKYIVNVGGLDWRRSKWNYFVRRFLRFSEGCAIRSSSVVISDNEGIREYIKDVYGRDSVLVEYGGDHVKKHDIDEVDKNKYVFLKDKYAFALARIQPDNNIEMILKAFSNNDIMNTDNILVFVGNWSASDYGKKIREKYDTDNIFMLDAIYDQSELNKIRSNCYFYVHGHSAGGTNPSLVEAMNLSLPVIAYSSGYNEYTTEGKAIYFNGEHQLRDIISMISDKELNLNALEMHEIAKRRYTWKNISDKYSNCINDKLL